jgi:hypothetical protein
MKRGIGWIATIVLFSAWVDAYAATPSWTNTLGGSFQTAGNWNPTNNIPGGLDTAEFKQSSASPYTVTLNDHVSVTNVTWPSGVFGMTLDLNGYSLTSASGGVVAVCSSATAGYAIDLTVKSSAPGGTFNLFQLDTFKATTSSRGAISITGSNTTVNVTNGSTGDNGVCYVGSNTTFTVSDGAHLNVKQTLLFGLGGAQGGYVRNPLVTSAPKTVMLITDPGTTYTNATAALQKGLIVGKAGTNMPTLVVSNGAACRINGTANAGAGGDTWYSFSPKANGKIVVTGSNSYFEANAVSLSGLAGEFGIAGSTAGGYVIVEKGGTLKTPSISLSTGLNHYYGGSNPVAWGSETNVNAYGEMVVRNPGSSVQVSGDVQLTTVANGALYVLDGATLLTTGANSTLYMSLGYVGTNAYSGSQPAYTNDNSYGLFVISNANSVANFKRVTFANVAGYGDVVVADNARLSVTNSSTAASILLSNRSKLTVSDAFVETYFLNVVSNSTIRIVLGARDHASAYIKLMGSTSLTLNANSMLDIGLLPNDTLNAGDTVKLLTYTGTRTGTFKDLPEGAILYASARRFKIAYGDGSNDAITLKYVPLGTMIRML